MYKRPKALKRFQKSLLKSTLPISHYNAPARTTQEQNRTDFIVRYKLLGSTVVPQTALQAMLTLAFDQAPNIKRVPSARLTYKQNGTVFNRPYWPTPRTQQWRTAKVLTARTTRDLATAVYFETNTISSSLPQSTPRDRLLSVRLPCWALAGISEDASDGIHTQIVAVL